MGTFLALLPALLNGFPFVYSDTGTYLRSAFTGVVPFDRPYWYGGFMKVVSGNGFSLWGVAIAQALLCAVWVLRVMRLVLPATRAPWLFPAVMVLLSLGTGLGWYAGLLIPDIFTGIGLLAVFALLHAGTKPWARVPDALLIIAACWFHTSNLIILPAAGLVLVVLNGREGFRTRAVVWIAVTLFAWGGLALANRVIDGEAYVTRNGHVFLMGRMLDMGMLGPYLDEHCPDEAFEICQYRDGLPPHSQEFLWGETSPVQRQGGWAATKAEYDRIVKGSFKEPRFLWWHARGSIEATARQLMMWEICHAMRSDWYRVPDSAPRSAIAAYMPQEEGRFMSALQNGGRGELSMHWPDQVYRVLLALSLVVAASQFVLRRGRMEALGTRRLILFAIAGIVLGAWACASLSVADSRYLGRDSWVLPLAAILHLAAHLRIAMRA